MATFTVTNLLDFGTGSLRQAILDANGLGGADEIFFDSGLSGGTINLTSGELLITDDLSINGLGADFLSVDAGGFSRVFNIDDGDNNNLLDVLIDGLRITRGNTSSYGGGILNLENLTVTNSTISGNTANRGGGIYSHYDDFLTVTNSTISGNRGGGISHGLQSSGVTQITNSTISDNVGSGIFTGNNTGLTVTDSIISGNGTGIINEYYSSTTVINSIIANNLGDGIFSTADFSEGGNYVEVVDSIISGNVGTGISNDVGLLYVSNSIIADNGRLGINNFLGEVYLSESTISANISGGIATSGFNNNGVNTGSLDISNSTISGNLGIGISNQYYGSLELSNSTVTGNLEGIVSDDEYSGTPDIENSIIAGNINTDVRGVFRSNGFNLIGETTGSTGFDEDLTFASLGGISIEDVLDTNLTNNGGSTLTHALISGSPAIDAGNNNNIRALTDQRGAGFERIVDGNNDTIAVIDIGAFEVQQQATSVPEPSSMLGLLGLVILGTGSILKRKLQQRL